MRARILALLAVVCLLVACSSEPPAPTSAQTYADVKTNLTAMDYDAAVKNLDKTIKSAKDEPLGERAGVLRVAVLISLADGSRTMAEAYGTGAKQPAAQTRALDYHRMRSDYLGMARVYLLDSMEGVLGQRNKLSDKPLSVDVPFPEFSGGENQAVERVKAAIWASDDVRHRAELEMDRNALAKTMAELVGAGGDMNKGSEVFKKGNVQIDPRVYLIELSSDFIRVSDIFDRKALDNPRFRRTALEVARDNMEIALKLLAAKPDKDLETRAKKVKAEAEKQLKALGA